MPGLTTQGDRAKAQTLYRLLRPVYAATAMTLIAEAVYFVVWGLILFPGGSVTGKVLWTATRSVATGAVVGTTTIILVDKSNGTAMSMALAALAMIAVGSFYAFLCNRNDYSGGPEKSTLFIASEIVPAVLGGFLYGWRLNGASQNRVEA